MGLHNNIILKKTTEARIQACNGVKNARFVQLITLKESAVPLELNFNVDFSQYNPTTVDGTRLLAKCVGAQRVVP